MNKEAIDKKNINIANRFFDYANPISLKNDIIVIDGFSEVTWTAEISGIIGIARTPYKAMHKVLEQIEKEKTVK